MKNLFLILCFVCMACVCGKVLSEEKKELPEGWALLATDPDDQILLNELFEKVCALGNDKPAVTSLLIKYVENLSRNP